MSQIKKKKEEKMLLTYQQQTQSPHLSSTFIIDDELE